MIEVQYNKIDRSYNLISSDNLVQGSKNSYFIKVWFGTYVGMQFRPDTEIVNDPDITVGLIFTRPDGKNTWFIPLAQQLDGSYLGVLTGWVLRKHGVLKIDVHMKTISSGSISAYNRITMSIDEGTSLEGDDFVFTEADWEAIWNAITMSTGIVVSETEPANPQPSLIWYEILS